MSPISVKSAACKACTARCTLVTAWGERQKMRVFTSRLKRCAEPDRERPRIVALLELNIIFMSYAATGSLHCC